MMLLKNKWYARRSSDGKIFGIVGTQEESQDLVDKLCKLYPNTWFGQYQMTSRSSQASFDDDYSDCKCEPGSQHSAFYCPVHGDDDHHASDLQPKTYGEPS